MKRFAILLLTLISAASIVCAVTPQDKDITLQSPNGKVHATVSKDIMTVTCQNSEPVTVHFGLDTSLRHLGSYTFVSEVSEPEAVTQDYAMLTGKRSHCHNDGTKIDVTYSNYQGESFIVTIVAYNDGIVFRYTLTDISRGEELTAESTSYTLPAASNRWMQQYNGPGYENFFPLCPGGISPEGKHITRWGYPALAETSAGRFVLLTEADVLRGHCGSLLFNTPEDRNTYGLSLFDETLPLPHGSWTSPWRVLITGSLSDIVESTLVTDVATPSVMEDTSWIEPGVSSWIYWAYNHGSQEYDILKQYVDLAADMQWPYTLVDAEWDVMRGGDIQQLVRYSVERGVKPMIWYNSTTNWTGQWAPTPQGRLNDPADRAREFKTIASWGVRGVKIDFFRDDKAETIDYYIDLMEATARERMLVNFHGGTIPRGWQRTYPNFISAESVYGAEWYNNRNILTNKAACHNATLPFTRNVIGSMDYTPGTFTDSQHPHITTHAHELALTILFESGIQHMPDRPETYRNLPAEVRSLLSGLPSAWDETRLLSGYPGKSVVLARKKAGKWYLAGINGTDEPQRLTFSLQRLGLSSAAKALVITDGPSQTEFSIQSRSSIDSEQSILCQPRGGFVIVME